MSNYKFTLKHRLTEKMHVICAIDNHFGHHVYGYRLPAGVIVTGELLNKYYHTGY